MINRLKIHCFTPKILKPFLKKRGKVLVLLLIIGLFLFNVRGSFTDRLDESWYADAQSNYLKMERGETVSWEEVVCDRDIYALAGWLYIHGMSPSEINFEHPPLGKYFIGISEILFHNPNAMNALFGLATLLVLYLLSIRLLGKTYFALFPVYILSMDKLFLSSSKVKLDIYSTFFVVLSVLVFLYATRNHKLFPLLSAIIGFGIASKWEVAFILPAFMIFLILNRDLKGLTYLIASLPIAFFAYSSTYLVYFLNGHNFIDFFNLHVFILNFFSGMSYPEGAFIIWRLLLTGVLGPEIRTIFVIDPATEEILRTFALRGLCLTPSFSPFTWPISIGAIVITSVMRFKTDKEYRIVPLWFIIYMMFLSLTFVLEYHLLTVMPSFMLAISYLFKDSYASSEGSMRKYLFIAIIVYLVALTIWSYINIPSFLLIP